MDTVMDNGLAQPAALEQTAPASAPADAATKTAHVAATRRSRTFTIAGIGALLVAAVAVSAFFYYGGRVSTDDAQVDAHIAPIAPKVGGTVAEILVDDNQAVTAGQVLVRIDPRDYQARVAQAEAALAAAESASEGAHAGVPLVNSTTTSAATAAEAQLAAATAELARARADFERASSSELAYAKADVESKRATAERAKADLARMEPLAKKDEITRQQFDAYVAASKIADSELQASAQKLVNAQKNAQASQAAVDAARARADVARAAFEQAKANRQQVAISSAQAGSASAAILQAKANLDAARLQLSYATIVAPIDGVVTRKSVQLGQIVQSGQSLLTIVPLKEVWVTANFKETQLAAVRPGQRAEVRVDMYGQSYGGHVDSIAGATGAKLSLLPPENATGNFVKIVQRIPVKIVLDEPPDGVTFRPGMNVDATVFTTTAVRN
jgi:membrane fusion protein (multidrug efflux system)